MKGISYCSHSGSSS